MLKIKNTRVYGLDNSIRKAKNPKGLGEPLDDEYEITEKDLSLVKSLGNSQPGSGHDCFLKGIIVQFDVLYPQYWSPEFQRYKFIDIVSSQSKMHKLMSAMKGNAFDYFNEYVDRDIIKTIQFYVEQYFIAKENNNEKLSYEFFMKTVSNLPMGYEMWMSISTNYLQLKTIYNQRKNHKLKQDWGAFCDWCLSLPRFIELTGV